MRVADACWMGIDPGCSSGALALIQGESLLVWKMPRHAAELALLLEDVVDKHGKPRTVVEKVQAGIFGGRNQTGERRQAGVKSTFSFGENFGAIQGVVSALRLPHELVKPQQWKGALGLRKTRKQTPSETKAQEHAAALRLFPEHRFPKYSAAAILLAEYARRQVWPANGQQTAETVG